MTEQNEVTESTTEADEAPDDPRLVSPLSRSISGTFQAVPVHIIPEQGDDEEGATAVVIDDSVSVIKHTQQVQRVQQVQQIQQVQQAQQAQGRSDFMQGMLKDAKPLLPQQSVQGGKPPRSPSSIEEQTRTRKGDLMAQIRQDIKKVPAIDEVFSATKEADSKLTTQLASPTVAKEANTVLENGTKQEELEADQKVTNIDTLEPIEHMEPRSIQAAMSTVANSDKECNEPLTPIKAERDESSTLTDGLVQGENKTDDSPVQLRDVGRKRVPLPHLGHMSSPKKLQMYEATPKERIFSISGMWSNIRLGFVKERAHKWQSPEGSEARRRPNYVIKNNGKRNSRIIDPNEWMDNDGDKVANVDTIGPRKVSPSSHQSESLHKSISLGNLTSNGLEETDQDLEHCEEQVMSKAVATWEQRANGRKSADIFATSNKSNVTSKQEEDHVEEKQFVGTLVTPIDEPTSGFKTFIQGAKVEKTEVGDQNHERPSTGKEMPLETTTISMTSSKSEKFERCEVHVSESMTSSSEVTMRSHSQGESSKTGKKTPEPSIQPQIKLSREARDEIEEAFETLERSLEEAVVSTPTLPTRCQEVRKPDVPDRSSSKTIVRDKLNLKKQKQQVRMPSSSPTLSLINVTVEPSSPGSPALGKAKKATSSSPLTLEAIDESPLRLKELADHERAKREAEDIEKKQKLQLEQEKRFHDRMAIEKRLRERQKLQPQVNRGDLPAPPPPPPPPKVDYSPKSNLPGSKRIDKIKTQELKEMMKLKEMVRRKVEIEEEIAKERQHLAELQKIEQEKMATFMTTTTPPAADTPVAEKSKPKAVLQYESMVAEKMKGNLSPEPPPVPPLPRAMMQGVPLSPTAQPISYEETVRDLETTTRQLKELAETRSRAIDDNLASKQDRSPALSSHVTDEIKEAAGAVREVAQVLLKALAPESSEGGEETGFEESGAKRVGGKRGIQSKTGSTVAGNESANTDEEDTEGYSEGNEDFSSGIELPISMMGANEQSSGNVTPIPTQGELEEISVEEVEGDEAAAGAVAQVPSPPRTPLKSLLKKQSFDADDFVCETMSLPEEGVDGRSSSPKKAVHFSEIDQIKLMSQESLVSTAPSDVSNSEGTAPSTVNVTQLTCSLGNTPMPKRNQVAASKDPTVK